MVLTQRPSARPGRRGSRGRENGAHGRARGPLGNRPPGRERGRGRPACSVGRGDRPKDRSGKRPHRSSWGRVRRDCTHSPRRPSTRRPASCRRGRAPATGSEAHALDDHSPTKSQALAQPGSGETGAGCRAGLQSHVLNPRARDYDLIWIERLCRLEFRSQHEVTLDQGGPKSNDKCLIRERRHTHTHEAATGRGGRDWSDVTTS